MTNEQTWEPCDYAKNGRFVATLAAPVVALLNPQPGESILDVGCGDGALTKSIASAGADVLGVDTSRELLAEARGLGLRVEELDAHALEFHEKFDAVFTNATLHWMTDLSLVLRNFHRALRPGGRAVGEFGGFGNVAAVCTGLFAAAHSRGIELRSPWTFPTTEQMTELLTASGFRVVSVELIPRPTALPGDIATWLNTFAKPLILQFPQAERAKVLAEVQASLAWSLRAPTGRWMADYVRIRFHALKTS